MDLAELKEILRLLHEKDIAEFELEEEGMKLRIRKASPPGAALGPAPVSSAADPGAPVVQPPAAPATHVAAAASGRPAEPPAEEGLVTVKSPIVGTFYRAPAPNTPPFVETGDRVKVGQVLCIVEAMKLMNEIESETAGEVVRIHVENGQPVQYGEVLFTLRPPR